MHIHQFKMKILVHRHHPMQWEVYIPVVCIFFIFTTSYFNFLYILCIFQVFILPFPITAYEMLASSLSIPMQLKIIGTEVHLKHTYLIPKPRV